MAHMQWWLAHLPIAHTDVVSVRHRDPLHAHFLHRFRYQSRILSALELGPRQHHRVVRVAFIMVHRPAPAASSH